MDTTAVRNLLGAETFAKVQGCDLPKIETMTLLQIWAAGSRNKLRTLAKRGELLPLLNRNREALEVANEARGQNGHLTVTECLQVAELPLTL